MDSFGRSMPTDEIFAPSNNVTVDQEPVFTTIDRLRRYDAVNIDTCRAPVYVPCNIPRWCPVPRTFFDHRQGSQSHYDADRYDDHSARGNHGLDCITTSSSQHVIHHSPKFIATSPNMVAARPCHYVDLDISNSREPILLGGRQHFQPAVGAPLSRETPCEYAQLDFDASGNGAPSQAPKFRVDTSASQGMSHWQPENVAQISVDYGFPAGPLGNYVGYESVGCQADLDDGYEPDSFDFGQIEDTFPPLTFASPYSEIPVYRKAYDQFKSPGSSPYRVMPDVNVQEQLKPYDHIKEEHSPRRQKGKKHRVSFKVRKNLSCITAKSTKWCAPNEHSDQPGHVPSLIRALAVRM